MAHEDCCCTSEDEDEVEDTTLPVVSSRAYQLPTAPIGSSPALTGTAKKKEQKQHHDHAKRKATTLASLSSTALPAPTPQALDKATQSTPIAITFAANDFHASKPYWMGLGQPLEHPLLAHAQDTEFLKKHIQYANWDSKKTYVILDCKGHIIGVLIALPLPGEDWDSVLKAATAALREACDKMSFPRERGSPQMLCYPIFTDYHTTKQTLLQKNPHLRCTFACSPFAAVTANLGPISVSPPHADFGNKANRMCLIGALGAFNADQGRHLVCWDYDLIDGEEWFSLIQYSAGGLFHWDVKVKNFAGRSRVEVWDSGDITDFSDLMDDESKAECPAKKPATHN
ncbi:hypothetical protein B0H14DRAFT_2643817 [Mycena olivaceomarginata]|nr:hypothetical protein B0H14DRAFT_2643817 [Mycena olivaceomarginata]